MTMRVLNVAEKPSVAKEIANILSCGQSYRRQGFSPYNAIFEFPYEIQGQSVHMAVTSVTGHLMELEFDPKYRSWQSCDPLELFTAPVVKKVRPDETMKMIEKTLMAEAQQCEWLVLWLDCDREGENIAFEVKAVCERASRRRLRVSRARFSALIPRDIVHAVQNLSVPDEYLSLACDARSEIDLRIGAAFTRFQTVRIQRRFPGVKKEKGVISYGPCQFPTLGFVVERFLKIQNFERESFHCIAVTHERKDLPDHPMTQFAWHRGRLYDRTTCLCIYETLVEYPIATIVAVDKRPSWKRKPLPLTTVELQKRVSRWLRVSSEQTMKAAESLYNKGFISYPRTETNKFKEGTDLMALVRMHEAHQQWGTYVARDLLAGGKFEAPREGGADDQAHPPIHPTKALELGSIADPIERKLYEFVARHFLACCSRDARGDTTNVQMQILDEQFSATGLMVTERNYLDVYKYEKWSTSTIPVYKPGDSFEPTSLLMQAGETAPPPLLSEADLIAKMDANGIGTDATIAEHIKTILKREYAVKVNNDTQFKPTTLGLALVLSYEQMGLELAKPALRAAMENDCKAIARGQKDIKTVVRSCMEQMSAIFQSVTRNAGVLDLTFLEHFGQEAQQPPPPLARAQVDPPDSASSTARPRLVGDNERRATNQYAALPTTVDASGNNAQAGIAPYCSGHDELCVERTTTKEGPNKGRVFFTCANSQAQNCGYFVWKDEYDPNAPRGSSRPSANLRDRGADSLAPPSCTGHQRLCVLRTTRKPGDNFGREFFSCASSMGESCGFFLWKDEHVAAATSATRRRPQPCESAKASAPPVVEAPRCECDSRGILLVCRTGVNKGRSFFKCSGNGQENQCSFFQWAT